jgi:hypothetical protein
VTVPTKHHADLPALSADTTAIILDGPGAEPPAGVARTHGFGGGSLELGVTGGPGAGGLWCQHETLLGERARAWGWTPHYIGPDSVRRFYGEALAWEADRGEPLVRGRLSLHADERDVDDDGPEDDVA